MTNPEGKQQVPGGWYWNPERLELRTIPPEGGALPDDGVQWRRLPGWLLIPAAPIVGGLFVIGLPVYGAAVIVRAVAVKTWQGASRAARALAASLATRPATGEAHLAGKGGDAPADEGEQPALDELSREIEERKGTDRSEED